jgi:hypothetical protein
MTDFDRSSIRRDAPVTDCASAFIIRGGSLNKPSSTIHAQELEIARFDH